MLWVRQTSAHSPRTLAKPRKRKWRNPRASLIWPKTDSQIEKRIHQSLLHEIVFALIRSVERRQIAIVCGSGIAARCLPGSRMFAEVTRETPGDQSFKAVTSQRAAIKVVVVVWPIARS